MPIATMAYAPASSTRHTHSSSNGNGYPSSPGTPNSHYAQGYSSNGYTTPTNAYAGAESQHSRHPIHSSPSLAAPSREFLVHVEMWCSSSPANTPAGSKTGKKPRSRPASTMFVTASGHYSNGNASSDELALAHSMSALSDSTTLPAHSTHTLSGSGYVSAYGAGSGVGVGSIASSAAAVSIAAAAAAATNGKKSGIAGLFGSSPSATGSRGYWRTAVCKLSGEGAVWPGQSSASPTGSALLTIYWSDDNTLQHVINVHKLTSTDVRPAERSLFNRSDVLAIWGHPAAVSLSTNPTLSPIHLAFPSTDAHNTWLVLLRSYTNPEIYGRSLSLNQYPQLSTSTLDSPTGTATSSLPQPPQGGLYRMWRQIEMSIVQTRNVNLATSAPSGAASATSSSSAARPGSAQTTIATANGANAAVATMPLSSVAVAASRGVNTSVGVTSAGKDGKDLVLGGGHDVSRPGTATTIHPYENTTSGGGVPLTLTNSHTPSFVSTVPTTTSSSGSGGNGTPPANATVTSLGSYSTASLGTSESGDVHHHGTSSHHSHSFNSHAAHASSKAREKELAKEREKEEKARKEREKKEKKERERVAALPGLFAEVVLHGEVCGRTTVRKAFPTLSPSSPSLSGLNGGLGGVGAEWFENMLFADLPSFENMLVMLWRAVPEGSSSKRDKEKESKEKDEGRPRSSKGTDTASMSLNPTSSTTTAGTTSGGISSAGAASNLTTGTGIKKNSVFVGCVEISLPNFRRGEWVEGWWPLYANANAMGAVGGASGMSAMSALGMGIGGMGIGGMSGVGGVAGALVQVGEMKLKIKVDEEIILPSRAYKNVLDALEQRNYLDVLTELEQKLRMDQSLLSTHIISLAVARNRLLKDIVQLAEREVMAISGSTNTLFRGNTVLTKTVETAMAWYGKTFLDLSVGPIVRKMIAENIEIEVDPSRLPMTSSKRPSTKDSFRPSTRDSYRPSTKESIMSKDKVESELQEQGIRALEYWCNELWGQIYIARTECPVELRRLFSHIRTIVERRFGTEGQQEKSVQMTSSGAAFNAGLGIGGPSVEMLPWQAISSFIFLRFLVPAILNPHLFGICPGMPSKGVVRSLTLLAKCTQSLANLNPGGPQKEDYMRGIKGCLERNTITMLDYLACVSTPPDQFSPSAHTSSFLSGPDKHDRLHVINSLRERLTGSGNMIPTLYKDAIPLLPYALDVPKHLAILSSAVVRNARSNNQPRPATGQGASQQDGADGWSLTKFSELCFHVEAQALKSVAALAQGAASAGAFGGSRAKRSASVSSYQAGNSLHTSQSNQALRAQQPSSSSQQMAPPSPITATSGSRGTTPMQSTATPTQSAPSPWSAGPPRRPASSRSNTTPTGMAAHGSNPSPHSAHPQTSIVTHTMGLPAPPEKTKKHKSMRPSTAPSSISAPSEPFVEHRSNWQHNQAQNSPVQTSFRFLPPEGGPRTEDVASPETPISSHESSHYHGSSGGRLPSGYPALHQTGSETFVPFHYPTATRYAAAEGPSGSHSSGPFQGQDRFEKAQRRSSGGRLKDFIKRPSTSSGGQPSPSSYHQQSGWGEHSPHSSSGDELSNGPRHAKRGASIGTSSGEGQTSSWKSNERPDTAATTGGDPGKKKKKGILGWLSKK